MKQLMKIFMIIDKNRNKNKNKTIMKLKLKRNKSNKKQNRSNKLLHDLMNIRNICETIKIHQNIKVLNFRLFNLFNTKLY
jgi:hypothetical protein